NARPTERAARHSPAPGRSPRPTTGRSCSGCATPSTPRSSRCGPPARWPPPPRPRSRSPPPPRPRRRSRPPPARCRAARAARATVVVDLQHLHLAPDARHPVVIGTAQGNNVLAPDVLLARPAALRDAPEQHVGTRLEVDHEVRLSQVPDHHVEQRAVVLIIHL